MAAELEMETLTEGTGEIAEVGKRVSVHYEGRLEDGTVFDGSRPRGQAFSFTIGAGQVIRGWEQGVADMKVGETRRLTIPPELGYGEAGAGGVIPPNATLVFEIELLEVTTPVTLGQATAEDLLKARADGVVVIDIRRERNGRTPASSKVPRQSQPLPHTDGNIPNSWASSRSLSRRRTRR